MKSKAGEHPGEPRDLDLQSQPRLKERKGMEETLFRAADQWRTIFDSIADFVCLLDSGGKILRCNKSMKNFLGKAFNEIINRPCWEVMHGAESRIAECPAVRMLKTHRRETVTLPVGDRLVNVAVDPIFDETGGLIGAVHIMSDITDLKQAEEALKRSEEKYRTILDNIEEGYFEVDLAGNFTLVNDPECQFLGYPKDELIGMNNRQYTDQETSKKLFQVFSKVYTTGEPVKSLDIGLIRKDGTRRFLEISVSLIRNSGGQPIGFRGLGRDITEKKRAEEALRESEDRYRDLVECSQYLILTHNLEGQILSVNEEGAKLLGYEQRDLLKNNIRDFLAPGSREGFDTYLETIRNQGFAKGLMSLQTATGEKRIWDYNNSLRTQGVTVPIVRGMAHDVTDLMRADKAVKQLSQENATIAEIGRIISSTLEIEEVYEQFAKEVHKLILFDGIAITMINHEDGTVTVPFVSETNVPGRQPGEVLSLAGSVTGKVMQTCSGLVIQPEDRKELEDQFPTLLTAFDKGLRSLMVVPLIYKDRVIGALHFRSLKSKAYSEKDLRLAASIGNQIAGAIANAQLFIERKRAEEEKNALQEQLWHAQKMEAIGHLAGGIAHDFNNLLTVIRGYSDMVLGDLDQNNPLYSETLEIKNASERAESLTRQLLAFSRKQVLQPKVLDFNHLVGNMHKMLQRLIGENVELVTVLAEDIGKTKVDPGQIEQVIINLAVNSRDAMSNGGKLTIETANVELDKSYAQTHINASPGHYVMLSVSDTGIGMTPEIKERIFEPFFTTKEEGKGTGLGLSTVYGIVKQSGGNIFVYSEPGHGTTFKIYLPRVKESVELIELEDSPKKSLQGSETILVVEDDEVVRKVACITLQKNGYSVLEAANAKEALRVVQGQNSDPIHLILTDVVMPGLSGPEMVKQTAPLHPETKVIYMSGYTDNAAIRHEVLEPGMPYLQKPFTPRALSQKVREILDEQS